MEDYYFLFHIFCISKCCSKHVLIFYSEKSYKDNTNQWGFV